ncbi:60S ribosomal protein L30 [Cucumispora dikerogammari]|nr:60S ribosomal protein L30 [Cucumispora dikerogammari]
MSRTTKNKQISLIDNLPLAISTGKITFGYKSTLRSLMSKECKLVILTKNFPPVRAKVIRHYAKIAGNVPIYLYEGNNNELMESAKTHHRIGVLSVLDEGNAGLSKFLEKQ